MKTILVPFDFSANARTALATGMHLAVANSTDLLLYHVLHESPYRLAAASGEEAMNKLIRENETAACNALREEALSLEKEIRSGIDMARLRVNAEYHPLIVEKIQETAISEKAGLIVMGTQGATGMRKILFGSNTSSLIAHCNIPVLAIPPDYKYQPVRKLMYATDLEHFRDELDRVLPFAIRLQARLEILHFDYGTNGNRISPEEAENIIRQKEYIHIQLVKEKASLDIPMLKQLRQFIESSQPGWIAMFHREKSIWEKLVSGSHTEDMAHALSLPLLSFRKKE